MTEYEADKVAARITSSYEPGEFYSDGCVYSITEISHNLYYIEDDNDGWDFDLDFIAEVFTAGEEGCRNIIENLDWVYHTKRLPDDMATKVINFIQADTGHTREMVEKLITLEEV